MDFIEKVKGLILDPTGTYQKLKEEELGGALRYFIIWLLIFAVLSALSFAFIGSMIFSMIPETEELAMFNATFGAAGGLLLGGIIFIAVLIGGIIGIFIGGLIIHLGVILVGGSRGYSETVKSLIYGGTPSYLFGWIPIIGFIGSIWALILVIFGIKELQDLSTGKAVIAVLIPVIIIAAIASFFVLGAVLAGLSNMPVTP
mgnify:CR=1 FL=1